MTPEELAVIKDALPLAQSRVRCMLETDRGNLAMMGARWTAEDVQPVVDAVPALVAEVERLWQIIFNYADHKPKCPATYDMVCNCGFTEALTAQRERETA